MFLLLALVPMVGAMGYMGLNYFMRTNWLARISHDKKQLELPIYSYLNPTTEKTVTLVGMIHIADKHFFKMVEEALVSHELSGAKILYEAVGKAEDKDIKGFTTEERETYENLKLLGPMMKKLADFMGLSYQKDALNLQDEWINTDMNMAELIRSAVKSKVTLPDVKPMAEKIDELIDGDDDKFSRPVFKTMLRYLPLLMGFSQITRKFSHRTSLMHDIILDERNVIAFDAIQEHLENAPSVVSVWGVGHVPGIERMLYADGFKKTSETWLTAVTLD